MVGLMPRTEGDFLINPLRLFGRNIMGISFFFLVPFPEPPVSEDKLKKDMADVVMLDLLFAMDTG